MKFLKYLLYLTLLFIALIISYIGLSYLLSIVPQQSNVSADEKNSTIYLSYDDIHSDIIINIENTTIDWKQLLPQTVKGRKKGYLCFGWGDRDTYINTPSWDDLSLSTGLKALFINTPSLVHVKYYRDIKRYRDMQPIAISKGQQKVIEQKILESFGEEVVFKRRGYGYRDDFYHSPYHYNLINTCNTWSGDVLRESNITMSYWTPFSLNVLESLK